MTSKLAIRITSLAKDSASIEQNDEVENSLYSGGDLEGNKWRQIYAVHVKHTTAL